VSSRYVHEYDVEGPGGSVIKERYVLEPNARIGNRVTAGQDRFFASRATHSTWWVIGKTLMVLSLAAILCARRRSGGERSP
jgi:hypothetical protein